MDKTTLHTIFLYAINADKQKIDIDKLKQLSADDWNEIIVYTEKHRIAALFYYRLRLDSLDSYIPNEFIKRLQEIHHYIVDSNVRMYFKISKVFSKLIDEDIPFIVQKGAVLAELVYPSIGLRPMWDIDILVKREDKDRLERTMNDLGWKNKPDFSLSDDDLHKPNNIIYLNETSQIEFHFNIHEIPKFDPWINVNVAKIASNDVLIMGKSDFLMHLCLHLYTHFYKNKSSSLMWWHDILEFTKCYKHEIDWNYMIKIAKEYNIEKPIYYILYLIKHRLGGLVPSDFLNQFKIKAPSKSINDILARSEKPTVDFYALIDSMSINGKHSVYERLYHIFRSIIPSREFIIFKYSLKSRNNVYFYYFVRIFTGIGKIIKGIFHLPIHLKPKD
jgi:hypothetical protein